MRFANQSRRGGDLAISPPDVDDGIWIGHIPVARVDPGVYGCANQTNGNKLPPVWLKSKLNYF